MRPVGGPFNLGRAGIWRLVGNPCASCKMKKLVRSGGWDLYWRSEPLAARSDPVIAGMLGWRGEPLRQAGRVGGVGRLTWVVAVSGDLRATPAPVAK